MKLCLNMIVKNESARIERALASVVPFINSWVIVDTGSTDDTRDKITAFFMEHKIPGEIRDGVFEDWSQARNDSLMWARKLRFAYEPDYFLIMDADMELVVRDVEDFARFRTGAAYDLYQQAGAVHYLNARLINAQAIGLYRGVTHEYLDIPSAGTIEETVAYFVDHADGANRPDKFRRDIRLLKKDLKRDPDNVRSFYYLAQSFRDAGNPASASKWFRRRVEAGGWDEEVWQAQLGLAHCYNAMGDEAKFIREALVAYNMRPTRPESMYDIAHHFRMKGMNAPALAFAEAVEHLPRSKDSLFVNDYIATAGIKDEISIASFYVPGKRDKGYRVTSELAMLPGAYGGAREQARGNLFHYLQPLSSFCPSFKWQTLGFKTEPGWTAMNPSVTNHKGTLYCNIRTVNYRMDNEGRYLINGTDGTANSENPIDTRNFLAVLGAHSDLPAVVSASELLPCGNLPCEFPLVVGFEDLRLISLGDELWGSATVRQFQADGNCEQVMSHIVSDGGEQYAMTDVKRMLRLPRETQKNWAPIVEAGRLRFMWRPLEVVDTEGVTVHKCDPGVAVDNVSGSSQLVPYKGGWLAVTHEARYLPGSCLRYYYHRFAFYDLEFTRVKFSRPFYFNDKTIEFCAGLCWHPYSRKRLVLSYGFRDRDACIATLDSDEVEKFLCLDQRS